MTIYKGEDPTCQSLYTFLWETMNIVVGFLLAFEVAVISAEIYFEDRFLNGKAILIHFIHTLVGDIKQWVISEVGEDLGKCEFAKPEPIYDEVEDGGMSTTEEARFYRYSAPFQKLLSTKGKDLCVQYSVKYPKGADCAGAYVKLLGKEFDPSKFNGETPYEIMFGKDWIFTYLSRP